MAHSTLIGGTAYEIKGGRTLVGGTGYDIGKGRTLVGGTGYDIAFGVPLSDFAEGSVVYVNENGSPVPFYVAKHNYEPDLNGEGRTLLVRRAICQIMAWSTKTGTEYNGSDIDTWQNETYKPRLSAAVQDAIGETTFYYTSYDARAVTTLSKSVFLLSFWELGKTSSYANKEGSTLPIASTLIPAVDETGKDAGQWVRSSQKPSETGTANYVMRIAYNGTTNRVNKTNDEDYGVRPCFTLPSNAVFDEETLLLIE